MAGFTSYFKKELESFLFAGTAAKKSNDIQQLEIAAVP
jgi:hypothetical protein